MKSYKQEFILLAILLVSLVSASVVFGEVSLGGGRTVLVNKHGVCTRVTNYNGLDLFIPTATPGEWSNFRAYAPNIGLAGITPVSFTINYSASGLPVSGVNIQCGNDAQTIGLRVQPGVYNTCSYPLYTGTTFDYWPGTTNSDGGCSIGGGTPWPSNRYPDFVFGTPATYSWQVHSGNGCDAGCGYQSVSYNGSNTITFNGGGPLAPYGDVTVTWDAAGNPSVNIPCDPNDPNSSCYVPPPPDRGGDCFLPDTKILTAHHEWKSIQDVAVGDFVMGRNGKANKVVGLYRPLLGNRTLYSINGEVASTEDHLFMTSSGKWGALDPKNYSDLRFNRSVGVTGKNGQKMPYISSRISPKDISKIEKGTQLELFNGSFEPVSRIESLLGYDAQTVLYTLVVDGNESFTVQGGYVADGMPQK